MDDTVEESLPEIADTSVLRLTLHPFGFRLDEGQVEACWKQMFGVEVIQDETDEADDVVEVVHEDEATDAEISCGEEH